MEAKRVITIRHVTKTLLILQRHVTLISARIIILQIFIIHTIRIPATVILLIAYRILNLTAVSIQVPTLVVPIQQVLIRFF